MQSYMAYAYRTAGIDAPAVSLAYRSKVWGKGDESRARRVGIGAKMWYARGDARNWGKEDRR